MSHSSKEIPTQGRYWLIPVTAFFILCALEWALWIWSPDTFFFSRGKVGRNLDYTGMIHGDLNTGNIFVTPEVRKFRFVTDDYSARNNTTVRHADAILIGQSFTAGGGSSQEFMPANQLARLSGKVVVNSAEREIWMPGYDQYEAAAFILKFNKPIATKTLIFDIVDNSLADEVLGAPLDDKVANVIDNAKDYPVLSRRGRFDTFKKHVKKYSPQAIIARKLKTTVKTGFLRILYKAKLFKRTSRTLDYLDRDGKVLASLKTPEKLANFPESDQTLNQMVLALDLLHRFAQRQGVGFLVTITPSKVVAYNRYFNTAHKIKGYGPAQLLYDRLTQRGIPAVMFHREMFKAVDEEMLRNGPAVYWGDDTHWNPYGIEIGMRQVAEKLKSLTANIQR